MDNFDFVIKSVEEEKEFILSNQAIGALMLALQNCILKQESIVELLKEWKLKDSDDGLIVLNPSIIKVEESEE